MTKTLKTVIREAREDTQKLHGTPYLIIHTRNMKIDEEDTSNRRLGLRLEMYPNQNQHLSGKGSSDHVHMTHAVLSNLHSEKLMDTFDRHSIYDHTFQSEPMNRALWDRHNEPEWSPGLPHGSAALDTALNKFKVPKGGLTTFSGLQTDPSEAAKKHPENKLFLPAYTSTSINPSVSERFSREISPDPDTEVQHIMKFKFPQGMNAGAYVGHISKHPEEYEFLTRRGMSVHLDPNPEIIPYRSRKGRPNSHAKIWTAHVLGFHEK